eukprot:6208419-Pleurochrysis_carterae.AAC.4
MKPAARRCTVPSAYIPSADAAAGISICTIRRRRYDYQTVSHMMIMLSSSLHHRSDICCNAGGSVAAVRRKQTLAKFGRKQPSGDSMRPPLQLIFKRKPLLLKTTILSEETTCISETISQPARKPVRRAIIFEGGALASFRRENLVTRRRLRFVARHIWRLVALERSIS